MISRLLGLVLVITLPAMGENISLGPLESLKLTHRVLTHLDARILYDELRPPGIALFSLPAAWAQFRSATLRGKIAAGRDCRAVEFTISGIVTARGEVNDEGRFAVPISVPSNLNLPFGVFIRCSEMNAMYRVRFGLPSDTLFLSSVTMTGMSAAYRCTGTLNGRSHRWYIIEYSRSGGDDTRRMGFYLRTRSVIADAGSASAWIALTGGPGLDFPPTKYDFPTYNPAQLAGLVSLSYLLKRRLQRDVLEFSSPAYILTGLRGSYFSLDAVAKVRGQEIGDLGLELILRNRDRVRAYEPPGPGSAVQCARTF